MLNAISTEIDKDCLFLCASLPDQIERKHSFASSFNNLSLFRFVESIDGRNWTDEKANEYVSKEMKSLRETERRKGRNWINSAAVACALTHRDGLLEAAQNHELILCADDVQISSDFIIQWQKREIRSKFAAQDGVVLLHYSSRGDIVAAREPIFRFGKYGVHKLLSHHIASGACYFAPPATAKSIISFQSPVSTTADDWRSMQNAGLFSSIYLVHPSPCNIAAMASTIGYGNSYRKNTPIFRLIRKLNRLLNKHRTGIKHSISAFEKE